MKRSMLRRREFLKSAGVLAASGMAAAPTRKPNLLFILADKWRAQTLTTSGDPDLHAPNLAQLAKQGVQFNRLYASYPLCSPSRAALLTGRFAHACGVPRNEVRLPLDQPSIAAQFKSVGYQTGYIGKWHLDGEERPGFVPPGPRRRGFDYWAAFNRGHRYFDSIYFRDAPEPIHKDGFEPDYQTDLAIDFLKRNKQNPFYLLLSWGPPHTPRTPPPRTAKLYDPRQFHLRPNVPANYEAAAREGHAGYYGLCSALDENVGRLLRALDELRLAADTIVVFTADHGDMLGSQGLEYKNVPFEESTRVPLLARNTKLLPPGASNDVLMSNVDLMPTLLGLCGVDAPEGVQGQDLSGLIANGHGRRPESVYSQGKRGSPEEWRMVVRGLDKLVADRELNVTHLYNLGSDPFEMDNLAQDSSQDLKRDELKALLKDWMRRTGDGMDPSGLKKRT